MKRIGAILCLSALIVTLTASFCFAGTGSFEIDKTYPKNEQKETSIDNLSVKIYLNDDTSFEKSLQAQKDLFSVKSKDGKDVPLKLLYDKKNNVILVLAYDNKTKRTDKIVKGDTFYTFDIAKELKDDKGNALSIPSELKNDNGGYSITFKTQNQARNTRINMYMMVAMFAGIFIFSSRSMKKQKEKEANQGKKKPTVNPYEEAKRTGKSVEEIVAKQEKKRAKEEAAEAKRLAEKKKADAANSDNFRVSAPKPISQAGGQFKTGRKAQAEEKAKKAEAAKKAAAAKKNGKKKK